MLSACPPPSGTRIGLPLTPPSLPSSPWALSPHAHTAPSTSRARECSLPAAIWVHRLGSSACPASRAISGPPHPRWPRLLLPHDSTCHQAPPPPSDHVSVPCVGLCKAQVRLTGAHNILLSKRERVEAARCNGHDGLLVREGEPHWR